MDLTAGYIKVSMECADSWKQSNLVKCYFLGLCMFLCFLPFFRHRFEWIWRRTRAFNGAISFAHCAVFDWWPYTFISNLQRLNLILARYSVWWCEEHRLYWVWYVSSWLPVSYWLVIQFGCAKITASVGLDAFEVKCLRLNYIRMLLARYSVWWCEDHRLCWVWCVWS